MSFLLVTGDASLQEALVEALVRDGDIVRVIEPDRERAARLKERKAFVAVGDPSDAELIERAGYGARTAVLADPVPVTNELLTAIAAARITRVVYAGRSRDAIDVLASAPLDHVVLKRKRGTLGRDRDLQLVVAAVIAADDVAGNPRVVVDLTKKNDLAQLSL